MAAQDGVSSFVRIDIRINTYINLLFRLYLMLRFRLKKLRQLTFESLGLIFVRLCFRQASKMRVLVLMRRSGILVETITWGFLLRISLLKPIFRIFNNWNASKSSRGSQVFARNVELYFS